MYEDNLDKILAENCQVNTAKLEGLRDIDIPELEVVIKDFRANIKRKKSWPKTAKRFVTAAAIVFLFLATSSVFSIFTETPKVMAVRFRILKTFIDIKEDIINITTTNMNSNSSNVPAQDKQPAGNLDTADSINSFDNNKVEQKISLDQLKSKVKFPVLIPEYLPEGYKLRDVLWTRYIDGTNEIMQCYYDETSKNIIKLIQVTNWSNVDLKSIAPSQNNVREITVMGENAVLISAREDSQHITWFKDDCIALVDIIIDHQH